MGGRNHVLTVTLPVTETGIFEDSNDNANTPDTMVPYVANPSTTVFTMHDVMVTSSNGNVFRVTGPLYGEYTGHRWIPLTKASDAEFWCFLSSVPEETVT